MTSNSEQLAPASTLQQKKRSVPFLIVIGLFGAGLGFIISILDPFIYTEKARMLAPPALKNTVLGFITIMSLLVALVIQPLIGRWSDRSRSRWGKRVPYLTGGTLGVSLSLALIVLAEELWLLVIGAMLVSASSNTTQGAWQALIPDRVPKSQHGTAAGIKTLLEIIGSVAGIAVIGAALARNNLWGGPLAGMFLFSAILATTFYTLRLDHRPRTGNSKLLPETENRPVPLNPALPNPVDIPPLPQYEPLDNQPAEIRPRISTLVLAGLGRLTRWLRRLPTPFLWWTLNRILFWSSAIALRTFLLNYMEDVLSVPLAEAQALSSRLLIILGLGVLLLAIPAGALTDRIGRKPLLIAAGLMAASGAGLFVFMRDLNMLFIAGGLIAAGAGIYASASWALATDLVPGTRGAQYLGLANSATVIGSISGRLGGPLIDGVNFLTATTTIGYLVVYGISALFFLLSSLVVLMIPEKKRGLPEP